MRLPPSLVVSLLIVAAAPEVAAQVPEAAAVEVITAAGDLDLDGTPEEIRLTTDGSLRLYRQGRELTSPSGRGAGVLADHHPGASHTRMQVVDIDRRDRQRELMIVTSEGDEDPPLRYRFLVLREGRLVNMIQRLWDDDGVVTVPSGVAPRIAGLGEVTFGYERCMRDADPERHVRGITEQVWLRYTLTDGWTRRGDLMENHRSARRLSDCIAGRLTLAAGRVDHRRALDPPPERTAHR